MPVYMVVCQVLPTLPLMYCPCQLCVAGRVPELAGICGRSQARILQLFPHLPLPRLLQRGALGPESQALLLKLAPLSPRPALVADTRRSGQMRKTPRRLPRACACGRSMTTRGKKPMS